MKTPKKNDIVRLEITDVSNEGNGVGRYEDMTVFVPATAVGDVIDCRLVKIKSSYCYGRTERLISPSEHRTVADCEVSRLCGGCCFRHMSYEEECRLKNKFIMDSFQRIGKLSPQYLPFIPAERVDGYRNKAQFPVADKDGRAVCGFYAKRSHRVVEFTGCRLQPVSFGGIVSMVIDFVNSRGIPAYDEVSLKGLLRHICIRRGEHSGETMVCLVVTSIERAVVLEELVEPLVRAFPEIRSVVLNENSRNTNVILGTRLRVLYGTGTIDDIMCGNRVTLSPLSFYQVNTVQAERLYSAAAELAELDSGTELLDLYCGTGTIGLSMAGRVRKLIGVEIIPQAIENAKLNAVNNGIDNAEFFCGDAGEIAQRLFERGERPDVIIADPARKGCDSRSLEYMARMAPDRIVYISCNHTTAARDCAV
ncbi:MAG: 23S rRNA (uracil(1939)-C(5))-methyltransferase RlmD, partial [Ruminococcus sp.]|nr:23S rRNA (uracil(1939)-C(5))-methyltransferase RlmD [Ruminococcus sp.]